MAIELLPPIWSNQDIVLYHGTTVEAATAIAAGKIDLHHAKLGRDFGPGFYTTTIERQAVRWARRLARLRIQANRTSRPAVVSLVLSREELAQFQSLSFVDGEFAAEQFWSFVYHCRDGAADHGRSVVGNSNLRSYDVVFGPLSASWNQRRVIPFADQISFHTQTAIEILNSRAVRSKINL